MGSNPTATDGSAAATNTGAAKTGGPGSGTNTAGAAGATSTTITNNIGGSSSSASATSSSNASASSSSSSSRLSTGAIAGIAVAAAAVIGLVLAVGWFCRSGRYHGFHPSFHPSFHNGAGGQAAPVQEQKFDDGIKGTYASSLATSNPPAVSGDNAGGVATPEWKSPMSTHSELDTTAVNSVVSPMSPIGARSELSH